MSALTYAENSYSADPATWQKMILKLDWLVMKMKTSFNKQSMKRIGDIYGKICSLENLQLVTRAELMRRNTIHNYPAPIPQLVQLRGALTRKIRRAEEQSA